MDIYISAFLVIIGSACIGFRLGRSLKNKNSEKIGWDRAMHFMYIWTRMHGYKGKFPSDDEIKELVKENNN